MVVDVPEAGSRERLDLFRYATADNAVEYLALMRLLTGTLLADLSAAEAAALLGHRVAFLT